MTQIPLSNSRQAVGFEKPRFKIEADSAKSVGLHIPEKTGLLVAPQKDLQEGEAEGYAAETGKPLGFLFLYRMAPAVDGKPVDAARLHTVKITNDDGKSFTVPTLLLSVRKVADNDWRLYGPPKKRGRPCPGRPRRSAGRVTSGDPPSSRGRGSRPTPPCR